MKMSSVRTFPAVLALAIASVGLSAFAQTPAPAAAPATPPTVTEKVEAAGSKAVNATERTSKKAWHATKRTAKKAEHATKKVATKAGNAVAGAGHKAANAMRSTGAAIGEKIPGTAENDAAKAAAGKKP